MKRSKREFGIARVVGNEGNWAIDGRCFEGPLQPGDVFRKLYRLAPDGPRTKSGWNLVVSDLREVHLRIETIFYIDRNIDLLSSGHTARLYLSGVGGELVRNDGDEVLGI